jgi:hypothetical protein
MDSKTTHQDIGFKVLQATIGYQLPNNWRLCGENLFAMHSIYYQELKTYFIYFQFRMKR